ncbi:MAG: hypothetical protein RQ756_07645 [Flavobacteriaceae bacterium]|nr:hypothetical protein [Flavobacteriaceae bacterium]
MSSIGLITAASSASVAMYERYLLEAIEKTPLANGIQIVQIKLDFEPINELLPLELQAAAALLKNSIPEEALNKLDAVIIPNFTLHEALDYLKANDLIVQKCFHLKEVLNNYIPTDHTPMLIGSSYTIKSGYLSSLLPNDSVVVRPTKETLIQLEQQRAVFYTTKDEELALNTFIHLAVNYPEVNQFILCCTEHVVAYEAVKNALNQSRYLNLAQRHCAAVVQKISVASLG